MKIWNMNQKATAAKNEITNENKHYKRTPDAKRFLTLIKKHS